MSGLSIKLGKTTITAVMQTIGLAELLMISDKLAQTAISIGTEWNNKDFEHDLNFVFDTCRAVTERNEYDLSEPMSDNDDVYFQNVLRKFSAHKFILMSAATQSELAHLLLNVYFYIKSGSTDTKK